MTFILKSQIILVSNGAYRLCCLQKHGHGNHAFLQ